MTLTTSRKSILPLALTALLASWSSAILRAAPQEAVDLEAQRERARQLLAESMRGPDMVLLQARAKAAQRLFAEAGDPLGEGLSLLTIASVEILQGDHEAGEATFDRAAELVTASGDVFGAAFVRMAEAATWRSVKRYEAAISSLEEAQEAFQRLEGEGVELSLDSIRYFAPQQFPPEVLEQVGPFLNLLKPVLLQSLQSMALVEIAGVQREQGLHEDALRTLDRAQALVNPLLGGVDAILVEKADVELALDRPTRARELLDSALPLARRRGDLALQARILRGLADVHERQGRHEEAAEYRERADALMPSAPQIPQ